MKRGFIRAVWGIYDKSNRKLKRRFRIDNDIDIILKNPHNAPFRVYVMGKENYAALSKKFDDCVLVHDDPFKFDMVEHQYRNKMDIIQYAMEEDGYDEMVYLDWDNRPTKALADDFWTELGKKEIFQANLQTYHRRKCHWRKVDLRKVPNGGFLYLRDKSLVDRAIKYWDERPGDNDEPAWARLVDEMMGGWKGPEEYWKLYEPMVCDLHRMSSYDKETLASKIPTRHFIHHQGGRS